MSPEEFALKQRDRELFRQQFAAEIREFLKNTDLELRDLAREMLIDSDHLSAALNGDRPLDGRTCERITEAMMRLVSR